MIRVLLPLAIASLMISSCGSKKIAVLREGEPEITGDTVVLFDQQRNRKIPVAIYHPNESVKTNDHKVIVFSHGYGRNLGGDYLAYTYLTEFLASKGYLVVSVQHELQTDSLMPLQGNPQEVRRPFWDRGVENILFVINHLKNKFEGHDNIVLMGHSNGADMTALFPQKYPGIVETIITLDNRRMPLPRMEGLRVFSIRSSDQPADSGVLPTAEEMQQFRITLVKLESTIHDHMDDHANANERRQIQKLVLSFLEAH
ncbi:MAG: alpha/beta hydrolase [Flavobacteriales bacterium]|nr:alpha/beta hydrolase [Flavobacteriales bacterium]